MYILFIMKIIELLVQSLHKLTNTLKHTHTHIYIYIYICVYIHALSLHQLLSFLILIIFTHDLLRDSSAVASLQIILDGDECDVIEELLGEPKNKLLITVCLIIYS